MEERLSKLFENRFSAGKQLALRLSQYRQDAPVVLALPRGGVPVGFEVAHFLKAPLGVIISQKIGLPGHPEFGVGAISEANVLILDRNTLKRLDLTGEDLRPIIDDERKELRRREREYRGTLHPPKVKNRTVILVDDGLATGVTARAAIEAVKRLQPAEIIFATPVCASDSLTELSGLVDDVVCVAAPIDFVAVGAWYGSFDQVTDSEVTRLLEHNKVEQRWWRQEEKIENPRASKDAVA